VSSSFASFPSPRRSFCRCFSCSTSMIQGGLCYSAAKYQRETGDSSKTCWSGAAVLLSF
jgi:hypothetical protein